jgi:hypothetical protein
MRKRSILAIRDQKKRGKLPMSKQILAAVAAISIAAASVVSGTGTAEAARMPPYNPTYCVLFLPFLCMPPPAAHKHLVHKVAMTRAKPAKK